MMKNVSKLLASVALCGLAALPSFTAPGATLVAAEDAAVEVVEPESDPASAGGQGLEVDGRKILEIFTDHCSVDVVIKAPFPDPDDDSTPPGPLGKDIILARGEAMCRFIGGTIGFRGVCQHDPDKKSEWTRPITYMSIMDKKDVTSFRIFRWFCGLTPERSRCKKGTTHVQFRLMPGREFQTRCLK